MKILLMSNANVNIQNEDGDSPLHIAVRLEEVEMVRRLIDAGAWVNIPNRKMEICDDYPKYGMIEIFIDSGAKKPG